MEVIKFPSRRNIMGCTSSNAATAQQQQEKPTELKENKKPAQPPPPPPPPVQSEPKNTSTASSEKKQLALITPSLSVQTAALGKEDEGIKKILDKSELDDEEPKDAANRPQYNQSAYFTLPKIQKILSDNITTKDKLIELFSILDDDNDGLLSEVEVDDIIYLVKTSYEEKKVAQTRASTRTLEDGPIMSEGIQIDFKNPNRGGPSQQQQNHHVSTEVVSPQIRPVSGFDYMPPNESESFTMNNKLQLTDGHVKGPPRRPPTKFLTPQSASPKKMSYQTPQGNGDFRSPRSNIMSDFDDEPSIQPIGTPHTHVTDVSALSPGFSDNGEDTSGKILRKKKSYVDEREFVGPPPASKKGFLMTSPMKENLYHVLDTGILYCIDSNAKSPKSFSLDRKGINLKGRKLIIRDDNVLELAPATTSSETPRTVQYDDDDTSVIKDDMKVEIRPRNERERQGWIKAIEEHLIFLDRQEQFKQMQDQEEED